MLIAVKKANPAFPRLGTARALCHTDFTSMLFSKQVVRLRSEILAGCEW